MSFPNALKKFIIFIITIIIIYKMWQMLVKK